jgi:hypothetical protein
MADVDNTNNISDSREANGRHHGKYDVEFAAAKREALRESGPALTNQYQYLLECIRPLSASLTE